jgi:hypothetical protein
MLEVLGTGLSPNIVELSGWFEKKLISSCRRRPVSGIFFFCSLISRTPDQVLGAVSRGASTFVKATASALDALDINS